MRSKVGFGLAAFGVVLATAGYAQENQQTIPCPEGSRPVTLVCTNGTLNTCVGPGEVAVCVSGSPFVGPADKIPRPASKSRRFLSESGGKYDGNLTFFEGKLQKNGMNVIRVEFDFDTFSVQNGKSGIGLKEQFLVNVPPVGVAMAGRAAVDPAVVKLPEGYSLGWVQIIRSDSSAPSSFWSKRDLNGWVPDVLESGAQSPLAHPVGSSLKADFQDFTQQTQAMADTNAAFETALVCVKGNTCYVLGSFQWGYQVNVDEKALTRIQRRSGELKPKLENEKDRVILEWTQQQMIDDLQNARILTRSAPTKFGPASSVLFKTLRQFYDGKHKTANGQKTARWTFVDDRNLQSLSLNPAADPADKSPSTEVNARRYLESEKDFRYVSARERMVVFDQSEGKYDGNLTYFNDVLEVNGIEVGRIEFDFEGLRAQTTIQSLKAKTEQPLSLILESAGVAGAGRITLNPNRVKPLPGYTLGWVQIARSGSSASFSPWKDSDSKDWVPDVLIDKGGEQTPLLLASSDSYVLDFYDIPQETVAFIDTHSEPLTTFLEAALVMVNQNTFYVLGSFQWGYRIDFDSVEIERDVKRLEGSVRSRIEELKRKDLPKEQLEQNALKLMQEAANQVSDQYKVTLMTPTRFAPASDTLLNTMRKFYDGKHKTKEGKTTAKLNFVDDRTFSRLNLHLPGYSWQELQCNKSGDEGNWRGWVPDGYYCNCGDDDKPTLKPLPPLPKASVSAEAVAAKQ